MFLKGELQSYIKKCNNRILVDYTTLKGKVDSFKKILPGKTPSTKSEIQTKIESKLNIIMNDDGGHRFDNIIDLLDQLNAPCEYVFNSNGDVYYTAS